MTEWHKYVAVQYPPAKYDNTNHKLTKPKGYSAHIIKAAPKPASTWAIPKMDSPGPGSYNAPESIEKQRWGKVKGQIKQTYFPPAFTDKAKKMTAFVPGSGHYKQMEAGKDKVARDVNFKYSRH